MTDSPTRSITVRLDADLLQAIREIAAKKGQSMNAEIAQRLAESVADDEPDDAKWLLKKSKVSQEEQSERSRIGELRSRLGKMEWERSTLLLELGGATKFAQGLIIKRLAELEDALDRNSEKLRSIDPTYTGR
ncbi:hypothetical protein HK22_08410 [Gluconobacter sp. DsW_056]|uniref:Arc family DNA-binding protein n=1 Tax=Gluconobacter sp. DsW_056 TaxID=1511209 RepID=UPI000B756C30|nr:Arc family DNA-binding protein [Gluconobacter sp. DsW_056]OUI83463.1 hypothetical protein HK22_08410 [Gluconobacter sp. DsW_056]